MCHRCIFMKETVRIVMKHSRETEEILRFSSTRDKRRRDIANPSLDFS